jgi:hypothetical protein
MYRLLPFGFALLLGCHDPTTGGDSDSLPLPTVSYSARHTYPIVARAVLPQFAGQVSPDSSVVHAFEFDENDISLANIVESEFAGESMKFVPRSQVSEKNGKFIDTESGDAALIWSIIATGDKNNRLRFRVDCRRSMGDSDSYEVILRGSSQTTGWTVEPPKKL